MTQAIIKINAVAGSDDDLPINTLVQLDNQNGGGELTYLWEILDQPTSGVPDTLSSATIQNPTFTPTKEGTYLLRLIVNFGMGDEVRNIVIAAVRQLKSRIRIPSAGETLEDDTSRGWASDVNSILQLVDNLRSDAGLHACEAANPLSQYDVVRFTGVATLKPGLPGAETAFTVDLALATSSANVDEPLGVVVGAVDGSASPYAAGKLLYVRRFGLLEGVPLATVVGNPIYVSDAGLLATVPGTVQRNVGRSVYNSGGTSHIYFDGAVFDYQAAVTLSNNAPIAVLPDSVGGPGVGADASRDDHYHPVSCAAPGVIAVGDAAAEGGGNDFARATHVHGLPVPTVINDVSGTASALGAGTKVAKEDHVHFHGAQTVGTLHAAATAAVNGFLPATDKALIDAQRWQTGTATTSDGAGQTQTTVAWSMPDNSVAIVVATVVGLKTDYLKGCGYRVYSTWRRTGGVTTLVATTVSVAHEDDGAYGATVDSIAGYILRVRVTGKAGETLNWYSFVSVISYTP